MEVERKENEYERKENEYMGHLLTPEGWRERRWRDGKETIIEPVMECVLPVIPKKFRDKHRQVLMAFFGAVDEVRGIGREIPILREELTDKMHIDKQTIKDLIHFGFLRQDVIPIDRGKHKLGGRAVVTPTLEGLKFKNAIEEAMKHVTEQIREGTEEVIGSQTEIDRPKVRESYQRIGIGM